MAGAVYPRMGSSMTSRKSTSCSEHRIRWWIQTFQIYLNHSIWAWNLVCISSKYQTLNIKQQEDDEEWESCTYIQNIEWDVKYNITVSYCSTALWFIVMRKAGLSLHIQTFLFLHECGMSKMLVKRGKLFLDSEGPTPNLWLGHLPLKNNKIKKRLKILKIQIINMTRHALYIVCDLVKCR